MQDEEISYNKQNDILLGFIITLIYGIVVYIPELLDLEQLLFNSDLSPYESIIFKFILRFSLSGMVWLLIIPYMLYIIKKVSLQRYGIFINFNIKQKAIRNVFIGMGISIIFFSSINLLAVLLGVHSSNYILLVDPEFENGLGWFVFVFAFIPGIWEEIAFRGVLLSIFMQKNSEKESIVYSSLLFSFFHIFNFFILNQDIISVIFQSIAAIFVGLALSNLVIKTKSIVSGVIIHYTIDVTLFISGLIFTLGETDNSLIFALFALLIVPPLIIYISTVIYEHINLSKTK